MGTSVVNAAGGGEQELDDGVEGAVAVCIGCGRPLASVLDQLGSLRCHDCRDGDAGNGDPLAGAASRR
jgi:hypothetical protein